MSFCKSNFQRVKLAFSALIWMGLMWTGCAITPLGPSATESGLSPGTGVGTTRYLSGGLWYQDIDPASTDPSITDSAPGDDRTIIPGRKHWVGLDTSVAPLGKLVLFLGGTASDPSNYRDLLSTAAEAGYHIIDLCYPNKVSMADFAQGNSSFFGPLHEELITGADASDLIAVTPANAIQNRFQKLLVYLSLQYPSMDWDRFFTQEGGLTKIHWADVVVAGFSQGAGHAAYIAKKVAVARVLLFSGVVDCGYTTDPPAWFSADWLLDGNWATGMSRFCYFINANDGYIAALQTNLSKTGFPTVNVDSPFSDINGHRILVTYYKPNNDPDGAIAHCSTAEDSSTKRNIYGTALYKPVWAYMFAPTSLGGL